MTEQFSKFLIAAAISISMLGCQPSSKQSSGNGSIANNSMMESSNQSASSGFISIFNGENLDNWKGNPEYWRVENGAIVGEATKATAPLLKANTFLIWQGGQPSDFILKGEYKISEGGNSGIQYRSIKVEGVPFGLKGYQLDIDGANYYTGQLYEERGRAIVAFRGQKVTLPSVSGPISQHLKYNQWTASVVTDTLAPSDSLKALIKPGWNTFRIIAKGNHLQHYINGVLMVDVTDNDTTNRSSKGLIGLQLHAGHVMMVKYRNLKIKKL